MTKNTLTILLLLVLLSSCGGRQPEPEPLLIVHYYRYGGGYDGWNLWAWPSIPDEEGRGFLFDLENVGEDGYVTARVYFDDRNPAGIKELGVIIRRSEEGNDWAEKDGSSDRFTASKEIWLVQNDQAVYTEKPNIAGPPMPFAAADSPSSVVFTMLREPADYSVFAVYEGERRLAGVSQKSGEPVPRSGPFKANITLSDVITDPSKLYTVRDESGEFGVRNITMRNILDSFYYEGNDLGLTYSSGQSGFKVWAPGAASISVALYDDAGTYNAAGRVTNHETSVLHPMTKDFSTGVWSAVVSGDLAGKFYLYRVTFADGTTTWAADPYAKAVSANGQRMAIVNLAATNPPGWTPGSKPPFTAGAWQDAVIYELHVRDFSIDENSGMRNKGKFLAFTERNATNSRGAATGVDHLVRLGITHVHLLPSYDFASLNELTVDDPRSTEPKFNWGYDPMHYNVPEGSYSSDPRNPSARITEFKAMVQSLHNAGIRVIMDVVYNHTFQTGTWPFDALVPGYYYRVTDTGAYANGSACGNEVASERPMVRKFIIDSCRYWASEYGVDGFRFDLMGLIDTPTMKQLTEELRRDIDPTIIVYGEPWQAGGSTLPGSLQTTIGKQRGLGFAIFNDRIRGAIKGGSDDASRGFVTGAPRNEAGIVRGLMGSVNDIANQANESINYVTAHDNLNLWDKVSLSHGARNLATAPYAQLQGIGDIFESNAVKSVLLANGIILTSQGIPFFQAGDEMLRSKFGDANSYASPDNINKIRWENASLYTQVIDYYAGLIRLRKEHPAFRQNLKEDIERTLELISAADSGISFILKENAAGDTWRTIFVAYNGSLQPKTFDFPEGTAVWHQVVDSHRAGVETLADFSGSVTIPALSMTVLYQR